MSDRYEPLFALLAGAPAPDPPQSRKPEPKPPRSSGRRARPHELAKTVEGRVVRAGVLA